MPAKSFHDLRDFDDAGFAYDATPEPSANGCAVSQAPRPTPPGPGGPAGGVAPPSAPLPTVADLARVAYAAGMLLLACSLAFAVLGIGLGVMALAGPL